MKTKYIIYDKEKVVGRIEINENNVLKVYDSENDFSKLIFDINKHGVNVLSCIHKKQESTTSHIIITKKVSAEDPFFNLAVRDYLFKKGFRVIEIRNDIDEKIFTLLKSVGTILNNDLKNIQEKIHLMTYFEKTYLFEKLKENLQSKNN